MENEELKSNEEVVQNNELQDLEVEIEYEVEKNPSIFAKMSNKFKDLMADNSTTIELLKGIGAVPAAVETVACIMSGNIPVAIGAGLVTAAIAVGGLIKSSQKQKESEELDLA